MDQTFKQEKCSGDKKQESRGFRLKSSMFLPGSAHSNLTGRWETTIDLGFSLSFDENHRKFEDNTHYLG
jgi:hypothetical protein